MRCSREPVDFEPFPGLRCPAIGEALNPCRHAMHQHEQATGRQWLASQVRERRRCRQYAQGYLAAVLGERRPELKHAARGWAEARLHMREIAKTRRSRHV